MSNKTVIEIDNEMLDRQGMEDLIALCKSIKRGSIQQRFAMSGGVAFQYSPGIKVLGHTGVIDPIVMDWSKSQL